MFGFSRKAKADKSQAELALKDLEDITWALIGQTDKSLTEASRTK